MPFQNMDQYNAVSSNQQSFLGLFYIAIVICLFILSNSNHGLKQKTTFIKQEKLVSFYSSL